MDETRQFIDDLRSLPAEVNEVDYRKRGYHLEVMLSSGGVRQFAKIMRDRGFYLVFVSAVHVTPAIEVIYQFAGHHRPCRIVGRVPLSDGGAVPTISDIFDGANWHERETKDMFGVIFSGHPCPEPLLLPEDSQDLRPLLKEEGAIKPVESIRRPGETGQGEGEPAKETSKGTAGPDPERG